jgi:hypothetical protein
LEVGAGVIEEALPSLSTIDGMTRAVRASRPGSSADPIFAAFSKMRLDEG